MHDHEFDDSLNAELQRDDLLNTGLRRELEREAQRMLGDSRSPPMVVLRAEFVRRRRQRALIRNLSAAMAGQISSARWISNLVTSMLRVRAASSIPFISSTAAG